MKKQVLFCSLCEKKNVSARCSGCHFVQYCSKACSRKDWAIHRRICHEGLSSHTRFMQPSLRKEELDFLRNYWSLDQTEKYTEYWNLWTNRLNLEHKEFTTALGDISNPVIQEALITLRSYIVGLPLRTKYNTSNDKQVEARKLMLKKSNFPFHFTAYVQKHLILDLGLDHETMFPLMKQIFRRYTLRTIQSDEWIKDESGIAFPINCVIDKHVVGDSLDRCFFEVIEIEKIVQSRERNVIIKIFDDYVVAIPCTGGRPKC